MMYEYCNTDMTELDTRARFPFLHPSKIWGDGLQEALRKRKARSSPYKRGGENTHKKTPTLHRVAEAIIGYTARLPVGGEGPPASKDGDDG